MKRAEGKGNTAAGITYEDVLGAYLQLVSEGADDPGGHRIRSALGDRGSHETIAKHLSTIRELIAKGELQIETAAPQQSKLDLDDARKMIDVAAKSMTSALSLVADNYQASINERAKMAERLEKVLAENVALKQTALPLGEMPASASAPFDLPPIDAKAIIDGVVSSLIPTITRYSNTLHEELLQRQTAQTEGLRDAIADLPFKIKALIPAAAATPVAAPPAPASSAGKSPTKEDAAFDELRRTVQDLQIALANTRTNLSALQDKNAALESELVEAQRTIGHLSETRDRDLLHTVGDDLDADLSQQSSVNFS